MSRSELAARAVMVLAIVLAPIVFWYMFDVVLVVVGALLLALTLRVVSDQFVRWLRLPRGVALALSGVVVIVAFGGSAYLFGARIGSEMADVLRRAEQARGTIERSMRQSPLGRLILSHMSGQSFPVATLARDMVVRGAGLVEGVAIAAVAGVYLAINPAIYRRGLVQLFPKSRRRHASETIEAVERALRLWLIGQFIQMAIIGGLSGGAVWLIGLPSPVALALIAGFAEFIPYIGPIIAAVPAVLVAATSSFSAVLWTIGAYLLIHQTEGNLLVPLIQRHMLAIPPGVMLLGIVSFSFLFGPAGTMFAAPMTVIAFILIKKPYVRDTLEDETPLPGE